VYLASAVVLTLGMLMLSTFFSYGQRIPNDSVSVNRGDSAIAIDHSLVGHWVPERAIGQPYPEMMYLLSDGTGFVFAASCSTWRAEGGRLYTFELSTQGNRSRVYDYKISGATLTLSVRDFRGSGMNMGMSSPDGKTMGGITYKKQ